ncbi:hypothetical protein FDUTEX481_06878 [Tolypothrix sp. PCC 7601]|nr:hypothetical protein FDUTEX481_06878 [Tolypothrix sp. PCC 7601]
MCFHQLPTLLNDNGIQIRVEGRCCFAYLNQSSLPLIFAYLNYALRNTASIEILDYKVCVVYLITVFLTMPILWNRTISSIAASVLRLS